MVDKGNKMRRESGIASDAIIGRASATTIEVVWRLVRRAQCSKQIDAQPLIQTVVGFGEGQLVTCLACSLVLVDVLGGGQFTTIVFVTAALRKGHWGGERGSGKRDEEKDGSESETEHGGDWPPPRTSTRTSEHARQVTS